MPANGWVPGRRQVCRKRHPVLERPFHAGASPSPNPATKLAGARAHVNNGRRPGGGVADGADSAGSVRGTRRDCHRPQGTHPATGLPVQGQTARQAALTSAQRSNAGSVTVPARSGRQCLNRPKVVVQT